MSVVSSDGRPSVYLRLWTYEPDPYDCWLTPAVGSRQCQAAVHIAFPGLKQLSAISGQQSEIRLIASAEFADG